MTDLGDLLGLPPPQAPVRARTRCADPSCNLPVFVDQLVFGYGHCCAEKRGLIVHRYRLAARPQTGETLLDHLPEETRMEPFPQIRIDVTDLTPDAAHNKILEHARAMISDPSGEIAAAYPSGITAASDDAFRGLAGILERHDPRPGVLSTGADDYSDARCSHCIELETSVPWPCDDYRDAARGLATGLPEAVA